MGSGAPDWQNPITVSLQTLSEIISRDKFGSFQRSSGVSVVSSPGTTTLVDISGTGRLFLSSVQTQGSDTDNKYDLPKLIIDGQTTVEYSYNTMNSWQLVDQGDSVFRLTEYSESVYRFGAVFDAPITFESSLKLTYDLSFALLTTISYWVYYALI